MQATPLRVGVFLDAGSIDADDIDFSSLEAVLNLRRHDHTPPDKTIERASGAQVIITNKTPISTTELTALPDLRLICVAATGIDIIDLEAARNRGVVVCNCRDYATASVAEHTVGLMLALNGRLTERQDRVRRGDWSRARNFALLEPRTEELQGRVLGVIGYGHLGQAVSRMAQGLGMQVMVAERSGRSSARPDRHPYLDVLKSADVVTLHCPLTPETAGMINRQSLAAMKSSALLINTARGGLIVDQDLVQALVDNTIAGAAVDVIDREPPPSDHPLLSVDLPHLIVTPHCAWAARGARQRLLEQLAGLVTAFADGQPINSVN